MLIAQKIRIYPNKEQVIKLDNMFGCARFVYNKCLENFKDKKKIKYSELLNEHSFLNECSSQVIACSIANFDVSKDRYFKKISKYPVFKSKKSKQSISNCMCSQVQYNKGNICFPKLGLLKKDHQKFRFDGKLKRITISKTRSGKYFASLLIDLNEDMKKLPTSQEEVGIDLGLKDFCIFSDGTKIENPKFEKQSSNKLRRFQRQLARRKLGSKNREKTRIRLSRIHEKITNSRSDFLHKLSWRIVRDNQSIFVENLNVEGMKKNHQLARAISDSSWSQFISLLEYKAAMYGRNLIKIDRYFPSSKTCHICGYVNHDLKLSDREWLCPKCGVKHDRDANAAINILNRGKRGDSLLNITNLCYSNLKQNLNDKYGEFVGKENKSNEIGRRY